MLSGMAIYRTHTDGQILPAKVDRRQGGHDQDVEDLLRLAFRRFPFPQAPFLPSAVMYLRELLAYVRRHCRVVFLSARLSPRPHLRRGNLVPNWQEA